MLRFLFLLICLSYTNICVSMKNVNRKIITVSFGITCQSFFMVNALIERTTAGSDYWIIIISLCPHNRERKDVCILPLDFFFLCCYSVLLSYKETTRYKQDLLQTGSLAFISQGKSSISHIKRQIR